MGHGGEGSPGETAIEFPAGRVGLVLIPSARASGGCPRPGRRRGASARLVPVCAALALLGVLVAPAPAGAVANVSIGNGAQQLNGTYLNAQKIANNLVFTSVAFQAQNEITIVEPTDLSKSPEGTPQFNLSLIT